MTAFRCERFPCGVAHIRTAAGIVVDFVDGHAEVDDPELAAALLQVPPAFGIVQVGEDSPPPRPPARTGAAEQVAPTRKSARRGRGR